MVKNNSLKAALIFPAAAGFLAMLSSILKGKNLLELGLANPIVYIGLAAFCSAVVYALVKWVGKPLSLRDIITAVCSAYPAIVILEIFCFFNTPQTVDISVFCICWGCFFLLIALRLGYVCGFLAFFSYAILLSARLYTVNTSMHLLEPLSLKLDRYIYALLLADCRLYVLAGALGIFVLAMCFNKKYRFLLLLIAIAHAVVYMWSVQRFGCYDTILKAANFYQNGSYEKCADLVSGLPEIRRSNAVYSPTADYESALCIGDLYFLADSDEKAVLAYNNCVRLANGDMLARVYNRLGTVYYFTKRYNVADECFDKALDISPKDSSAYIYKSLVCTKRGDYKSALLLADTIALKKLNSDSAIAWIVLAEAFANLEDKAQMKASIAMALGKLPDYKIDDPKRASKNLTRKDFIR